MGMAVRAVRPRMAAPAGRITARLSQMQEPVLGPPATGGHEAGKEAVG